MKNLKLKLLVGLIGLSFLGFAQANTTTTNQRVTTTVSAKCTITATDANFGVFSPNDQTTSVDPNWQYNTTAKITPICSKGVAYSISSNMGQFGSGYYGQMTNTTTNNYKMTYQIAWHKANGSIVDFQAGKIFASGVGAGFDVDPNTQAFEVLPAIKRTVNNFRRAPAGAYKDTVTLTITY